MKADFERPSDDEAIEAQAAAWLAERDDGLPPEKVAKFARWRAADARHEAAVARLENTWATLQSLRDFRPEASRHPERDLLRPGVRAGRRVIPFRAIATTALAASLVLVAVWWFGFANREGELAQNYATTVDGYQRLTLPDGSLLELNANTELNVRYTRAERRVQLVRGEAHFTVAKNPARPFRVEAGNVAVRAVGTAFNVRLGAKDVEVLVTEGKVEVGQVERGAPAAPTTITPLAMHQRALVSTGKPAVETLEVTAIREALAWQGPRLTFWDTPLSAVVMQFNRQNEVQLELADAELGALLIGGSFQAQNVKAFVRLLEEDKDIIVERPSAARIVLRKAR